MHSCGISSKNHLVKFKKNQGGISNKDIGTWKVQSTGELGMLTPSIIFNHYKSPYRFENEGNFIGGYRNKSTGAFHR